MTTLKFKANEIPLDELKANYKYDPATGIIYKLSCGVYLPIGHNDSKGYLSVSHNGKNLKAHRIAYALYYDKWPECELDHINQDKKDNRICNLRNADRTLNNLNRTFKSRMSLNRKLEIFQGLLAGESPSSFPDLSVYFPYSFKNC